MVKAGHLVQFAAPLSGALPPTAATPGMMSHRSLAWHHPPAVAVVIQVCISRIQKRDVAAHANGRVILPGPWEMSHTALATLGTASRRHRSGRRHGS